MQFPNVREILLCNLELVFSLCMNLSQLLRGLHLLILSEDYGRYNNEISMALEVHPEYDSCLSCDREYTEPNRF